eukprot:SAG31_NODE_7404_length_1697_cov_2.056946_1_plen_203_part_10
MQVQAVNNCFVKLTMSGEGMQNPETVTIVSDLSHFMRQLDELDEAEVEVKRAASNSNSVSAGQTPPGPKRQHTSAAGKRNRSADQAQGHSQQPAHSNGLVPNPPKRFKPSAPSFNVLGIRSARTARIIRENSNTQNSGKNSGLLSTSGSDVASEPSDPVLGVVDIEMGTDTEFLAPASRARVHSGRPHHQTPRHQVALRTTSG